MTKAADESHHQGRAIVSFASNCGSVRTTGILPLALVLLGHVACFHRSRPATDWTPRQQALADMRAADSACSTWPVAPDQPRDATGVVRRDSMTGSTCFQGPRAVPVRLDGEWLCPGAVAYQRFRQPAGAEHRHGRGAARSSDDRTGPVSGVVRRRDTHSAEGQAWCDLTTMAADQRSPLDAASGGAMFWMRHRSFSGHRALLSVRRVRCQSRTRPW